MPANVGFRLALPRPKRSAHMRAAPWSWVLCRWSSCRPAAAMQSALWLV